MTLTLAAGFAVLLLLAVPADPARADDGHPGGSYPLHQAAGADGDLAAVIHLLGSAHTIDVNAKTPSGAEGETPLHSAVNHGRTVIVATLIAAGADVNAKNSGGRAPLHDAASDGDSPIASMLISAGANVNATNNYGSTPLFSPAQEGRAPIISVLISAGADVNAKNNNGRTPLYISDRSPPVLAALLAAGGHWGDDCAGDETVVNPAGPSPPCVCEGRFYSEGKSACVPYAPCLGGTLDAGTNTCECPDGLATLGDGGCEYAAATCETLGGEVEGEDDRVCSGIDWNDTFCIVGSASAFPCLGLFYHVWQCNDRFNRPALDPWHCAKPCEVGFRARGAKCRLIN